jgi:hypothetical protein
MGTANGYNHAMPGASLAAAIAQYVAFGFKVGALLLLGFWGFQCFKRLSAALDVEQPGIETSWGGLGGSLGGWSMSKSLAWLLVTLLTLTLFAVVALQLSSGLPAVISSEAKAAAAEPAKSPAANSTPPKQ